MSQLPASSPIGHGRFAILVDDDAIVLMGLEIIFRDWGYDVLAAGNADKALSGLLKAAKQPDVVVADYQLRGGQFGTEAIRRIREQCGKLVPGVILTGEAGTDCEREATELGVSVVYKPVTPRLLGQTLERILQRA